MIPTGKGMSRMMYEVKLFVCLSVTAITFLHLTFLLHSSPMSVQVKLSTVKRKLAGSQENIPLGASFSTLHNINSYCTH